MFNICTKSIQEYKCIYYIIGINNIYIIYILLLQMFSHKSIELCRCLHPIEVVQNYFEIKLPY